MLTPGDRFEALAKDWRNGAIVYQVFVDRFCPPANLASKRSLYSAPQALRTWAETPRPSVYDPKIKTYPHVLEFWGGDIVGLRSKLDYVKQLGADVLYLLPIFKSPSNHKYDTEDYFRVDPQYGTAQDLKALIADVHRKRLKIMLDGVFNHIGATSPFFREARANPRSSKRGWFYFGDAYKDGYLGWAGVSSLPRLRLDEADVRKYLWESKASVVQKYLRDGIDGWRLDVAFELGPEYLRQLTQSAHKAKPGCAIVGEIAGYPSNWFSSVDGVFNFAAPNLLIEAIQGRISGGRAGRMLAHMVEDAGLENLLKSWILAENHDTPRLANQVPNVEDRKLVQALQFTFPGSPCVYYGMELGMKGAGDPTCRAPMRWDLASPTNPDYAWVRKLISIRKSHPALRVGAFTALDTDRLIAFVRTTNKLRETVLVAINPTDGTAKEEFPTRVGRLMSWGEMRDLVSGKRFRAVTGLLSVEMAPKSAMLLTPVTAPTSGYSPYERIR